MRLINADELRYKMCYTCIDTDEEMKKGRAKWDSGLWIRYKVFEDTLILAPTVEAEPIRHGHWIFKPKDAIEMMFTLPKCSICGAESSDGGNYCSNCGAKMDEVKDE